MTLPLNSAIAILARSILLKHSSLSRHRKSLVSPNEPTDQCSTQHNSEDRPRIIHIGCCDWQIRREGQPDNDEDEEANGVDIDGVSAFPEREMARSDPLASHFVDEEGDDDLQVGSIERKVIQGEDGVERRCRGNVQQHEQPHDG